jgi:probable HAF family extracellular repeat protein
MNADLRLAPLSLGCVIACSGIGVKYSLTGLGTLGGKFSQATAINSSGQVVGWFVVPGSSVAQHGFLYSDGVM